MTDRRANTLIELIIYLGLTIVIVVGLSSITTRLRQVEVEGSAQTDVQQSLRSLSQQLHSVAGTYQTAEAVGSDLRLWNEAGNEGRVTPQTYVLLGRRTVMLAEEISIGAVFFDEYVQGALKNSVRLTPDQVDITELSFVAKETESGRTPLIEITLAAKETSGEEQWRISSALLLKPLLAETSRVCCPAYLDFCPVGIPVCGGRACFESGMQADGVLGQTQNGLPVFTQSAIDNNQSPAGPAGVEAPHGLALDRVHNRLFVADTGNNRVLSFDLHPDGTPQDSEADFVYGQPDFTSQIPNGPDTSETLDHPQAVAYDEKTGRLVVADTGNNRVLVFAAGAELSRAPVRIIGQATPSGDLAQEGPSGLTIPSAVTVDEDGRLFVADQGNNRVLVFADTNASAATLSIGQSSLLTNEAGNAPNRLHAPKGLAIGNSRLFVADRDNDRVLSFDLENLATDMNGSVITVNAPADEIAPFDGPTGLAFDGFSGRLFVSDRNHDRILSFSGAITGVRPTTVLGQPAFTTVTAPSAPAADTFLQPAGMAFDAGNVVLYLSDTGFNRILRFDGGAPVCNGGPALSAVMPLLPGADTSSSSTASATSMPPGLSCTAPLPIDRYYTGLIGIPTSYIETCQKDKTAEFDMIAPAFDVPNEDFAGAERIMLRLTYILNEGLPAGQTNQSGYRINVYRKTPTGLVPYTKNGASGLRIDTMNSWETVTYQLELNPQAIDNADALRNIVVAVTSIGPTPSVRISELKLSITYRRQSVTSDIVQEILPLADRSTNGWSVVNPLPVPGSSSSSFSSSSEGSSSSSVTVIGSCPDTDWVLRSPTGDPPSGHVSGVGTFYSSTLWLIGSLLDDIAGIVRTSQEGTRWTIRPTSLPQGVSHAGIASSYSRIFITGGYAPGATQPSSSVFQTGNGNQWTTTSLPISIAKHASVYFNNKVWIIGGETTNGALSRQVLSSADGVSWTRSGSAPWNVLPEGLRDHSAVVFRDPIDDEPKIWVFGGTDGSTVNTEVWKSADGVSWLPAGTFPNARVGAAAVVYDGRIWSIGGNIDPDPNYLTPTCDVYASRNGTAWNFAGSLPRRINEHVALTFHDPDPNDQIEKIWLLGGKRQRTETLFESQDNVYSYGQPSLPRTSGPISRWRLEENGGSIADDSISGYDLSLYNTGWTADTPPSLGDSAYALGFNGINSRAVLADGSPFALDVDRPFTIAFWIKNTRVNPYAIVLSHMDGQSQGYAITVNGGNLSFLLVNAYSSIYSYFPASANNIPLNEYVHVTITYDPNLPPASRANFYINGALVSLLASQSAFPLTMQSFAPLEIGKAKSVERNFTFTHFEGLLDDIQVFGEVVVPSQIPGSPAYPASSSSSSTSQP